MLLPPCSSASGSTGKRGADEPKGAVVKLLRRKKQDEKQEDDNKESENKGKDKNSSGGKKLTKAQAENKQLWSTIIKAILGLQQEQRSINSVILYTLIVDSSNPEVCKMIEQGKAYGQLCQEQPRHQQGPPHLFVFAGLLVGLQERKESIGIKNLNIISSMIEKWQGWDLDDKADSIRLCRQAKCWDPKNRKIFLAYGNGFTEEEQRGVVNALTQCGAILKHGRAPTGALERELSQWLSAFTDAA